MAKEAGWGKTAEKAAKKTTSTIQVLDDEMLKGIVGGTGGSDGGSGSNSNDDDSAWFYSPGPYG